MSDNWKNARFVIRVLESGNQATEQDKADAYFMVKEFANNIHSIESENENLQSENKSLKRERAMLVEALHDIEDTRLKGYIDRVAEIAHYALYATDN